MYNYKNWVVAMIINCKTNYMGYGFCFVLKTTIANTKYIIIIYIYIYIYIYIVYKQCGGKLYKSICTECTQCRLNM